MPTTRSRLRVTLAHTAYGLVVHLAALVALVPQLLKTAGDPERRRWLRRRLGDLPQGLPDGQPVWIHAVSVGEVKAARPLLAELRRRAPGVPLVLTTGTLTGYATARRMDPELYVFAWPLDLPHVVRRVLDRVRPRLVLMLELEVWPTMMRAIDERGVPQVIVNARISETSFLRYRRLNWWLPEFDRLTLVAAQDETIASRLERLGVPAERLSVTGNLKHELPPAPAPSEVAALSAALGLDPERPVFVAGSTHDGEDELALQAWRQAGGAQASQLLIVPRHLERVKDIGRLLERSGVPWGLRGAGPAQRPAGGVLLVDSMGELERLFALADVVFLGGSLVPVGGHNVLEPAAAGRPVLVGPHLESCRAEAAILEQAGGLLVCADAAALGDALAALLAHPDRRRAMGEMAREAVEGLAGAAAADVELLVQRGLLEGRFVEDPSESASLGPPFPTHDPRPGVPPR